MPNDANADGTRATIVLEHDYIDLELAVIDALLVNLPMRVVGEGRDGCITKWQVGLC